MKTIFRVRNLSLVCLVCIAAAAQAVSSGDSAQAEGAGLAEKLEGRWLICDMSVPGAPAALEIPGDGFVRMLAIRSIPPFNEKDYDQWIFKPQGDTTATAKSPGGDEMSLALEKAGDQYLLEVKMDDTYVLLYRPENESDAQGFEGTWNMPDMPIIDFTGEGTVEFPSGSPVGSEETGTYAAMSGNRIAVYAKDKEGVETVLVVLEPLDDFNMMKVSGNEEDYREAGEEYEPPPDESAQESFSLVKGPAGDFFYQQPLITNKMEQFRTSRQQADYLSCYYNMLNLQTAQEMYHLDNGEYAVDISQLDQYTFECTDTGDCEGSVLEAMDKFCLPGSFKLERGETGDNYSYRMTAKTKDEPPCNICVTEMGGYPETYEGCPNEEMLCSE